MEVKTFKTVELALADVKPDEKNERVHSKEQIEIIKQSIEQRGFYTDIIVDENKTILVGHARYEALTELGAEKVTCKIIEGLSDAQKHKFRVADNKASDLSEFDLDKLKDTFSFLADDDFDLDDMGFEEFEIDAIMDIDMDIEDDADAEVETQKVVKDGTQRLVLLYSAEDFVVVKADGQFLREKLGIVDDAQLFKFLIDKEIGQKNSAMESEKDEG